MKMSNVIKFSGDYPKLHGQSRGRLLAVEYVVFGWDYPEGGKLWEYDTKKSDGTYYPLKPGVPYLQLIFLGGDGIPFCTLRRDTPEKQEYYRSKVGEWFDIDTNGFPSSAYKGKSAGVPGGKVP
jgi:hypothetical protein